MAINQITAPQTIWPVRVPVKDEQMGDILSTSDDHFGVVALMRLALIQYAHTHGLSWLVRADAALVFPRVGGDSGSLFPDLLVAFNVAVAVPGNESYHIQEVGKPPELLVEILSDKTAKKDQDAATGKLGAYAEMGVQEYLTFDPRPRRRLALVGHRLVRVGTYAPIVPEAEGGLWLETLGLRVVAEPENRQLGREPRLRFYTADGSPLPHADEEAALREQAEWARALAERRQEQAEREQIQAERERIQAERRQEQAEQRQLRAERERAQAVQERERAERAQLRAEHERAQAIQERERAERERAQAQQEMERKVAALEARLAEVHGATMPPPDDLDSR